MCGLLALMPNMIKYQIVQRFRLTAMTKIETLQQYNWAVNRVEELLPLVNEDTPQDDPNLLELDLLSNLVADYSDVHFDIGTPSLIDVLKLRMYELGLSQAELAKKIGVSASRISDYLSGKREPTLKVCRRINSELNIDPAIILGV